MENKEYQKIRGKVIRGKGKGQKIGFPTANLDVDAKVEGGVYAGIVEFEGRRYKAGLIYFADKKILEVHILDFSGDLYGKEIDVEIGKKIREPENFDSDAELISQIKKDLELIKNYYSHVRHS